MALSYDPSSDSANLVCRLYCCQTESRWIWCDCILVSSLARALYFTTEINQSVPEALYHAVAQVIAYVFSPNGQPVQSPTKPDPQVPAGMRYNADGTLIDK